MEEAGKMTVEMKQFGAVLVTRYAAKRALKALSSAAGMPTLDFSGVEITNHSFADEFGKGLIACFSVPDLSKFLILGANGYVSNSLQAGFSTAAEA